MNAKSFVFWSSVGIVTLSGAFLVIRWLIRCEEVQRAEQKASEAKNFVAPPRREVGFHAIAKDHTAETT
jgi:hypothetical protein